MNTTLMRHLKSLGACDEALAWIGTRTPAQAWEECERADWLLWWAGKTGVNTTGEITLAACACARRALRFVPAGEERPRLSIEATEADARGSTPETRAARDAAGTAAWTAGAAAWTAAGAAAKAAAWAAANSAVWTAVVSAANAAAAADVGGDEHRAMCIIVRQMLRLPYWGAE